MKHRILILGLLFFGVNLLFPRTTFAVLTTCSASVSPSSVANGSTTDFSFTVTNDSPTDGASWMKVDAPGEFTVNSFTAADWSPAIDGQSVVFSGGSLGPGESYSFTISADAKSTASGANWNFRLSDTGGDEGGISCSGSLGASSTSGEAPPQMKISGISAQGTASSATITWTTDSSATSVVEYGLTDAYGSTQSSTDSVTSHSIALSNLASSSTYHFKVKSVDSGNNEVSSGDNTFTTSESGSVTVISTSTTTSSSTNSTSKPTPTPPPDIAPPTVTVNTNLSKPFSVAPRIQGVANDDRAVAKVEYSIDGGNNWFSVPYLSPQNQKTANFSFTPPIKEDGNYNLVVRAQDGAKNTGYSGKFVLIYDTIPPKIGGYVITSGSQILGASTIGTVPLPSHQKYSLLFSSIGGATDINIVASPSSTTLGQPIIFTAIKNEYTNTWTSELQFDNPGDYAVSAEAVDGADNKTTTQLLPIHVLQGGTVISAGKPVSGAKLTVYYFNQSLNTFAIWDGKAYAQQNPIITSDTGNYSFTLPKGSYYVEVVKPGYKRLVTDIFTFSGTTTLNNDFVIRKTSLWMRLPLMIFPSLFTETQKIVLKEEKNFSKAKAQNEIKGKKIGKFKLVSEGKSVTEELLKGKRTIMGITNSWLPQTQIMLEDLASVKDRRTLVVFPHESDSFLQIYKKRGNYAGKFISDPNGDLLDMLYIRMLPSYVYIDENGVVKDFSTGVFLKGGQ